MKAIVVMFDSLNRHMLAPYGCDWTKTPHFQRLAEKTVTFDRSYICSMPCMPARRDFHTGRPNFLHTSWGPLEPFDDSVPRMLRESGVSSHLISDHYHYWESGGSTYHTQYSTWQFFRGQEGDPWIGQVEDPPREGEWIRWNRQDQVNRGFMTREERQPQHKTFAAGLDFIDRNHDQDNWFLQIETFDPHEPFFAQPKYQELYRDLIGNPSAPFDWPPYGKVKQARELVAECRGHYAALLSMCDAHLGKVIDRMDALNLWDDTLLVVWTDHGFLLGEHDQWAKIAMPWFNENANTPLFAWDPRCARKGERRGALVQPAIDLGPTLLEFFGAERTPQMLGKDLTATIATDASVRDAAIFGSHGGQVNVTDGRYVYMRSAAREDNQPLFDYTLMPQRMRGAESLEKIREAALAGPFAFTQGCSVLKMPSRARGGQHDWGNQLFDLEADPGQENAVKDADVEKRLIGQMVGLMRECDSPPEQYERLGLEG